jgi:hypothetical protein
MQALCLYSHEPSSSAKFDIKAAIFVEVKDNLLLWFALDQGC